MTNLNCSVIIPNYNGKDLLEKNLPFVLEAKKFAPNKILEVIVIDDSSSDESVDFIKTTYPWVKLIRHKVNRGFSSAINTGVRSSQGNLLVLLNNDVVVSKDFLVSPLSCFNDQNVFAVSLHEKGYGPSKGSFKNGFISHSPGKEDSIVHETFWVSGGSGIFRKDIWAKLKGMDEKLLSPLYWEDLDLCYRSLKQGYKLLWDPKAIVTHEHESTAKKLDRKWLLRIQERNQLLFIWKNLTSPNLFRKHILGLLTRILQGPGYVRIVLMALAKIGLVIKARAKEKKAAEISDEAIFAKF